MTRIITHLVIPLFCFFLFSLETMSQSVELLTYCNQLSDNFNRTSSYRSNRDTVLSTLRDRSSLGSYSNATAGLSPNTVYGMFLCRGDINRTSCSNSVHTATLEVSETCNSSKGAFIFYDECMVRYSNFFTLVEDVPTIARYSPISSLGSSEFFNLTLPGKIDELILRASSSSSSPIPYFAEEQEHVTQLEGSYDLEAMAQCSPDLDPRNCTECLRLAAEGFFDCCSHARLAQIFFPKCLVKYNISALQPSLGVTNVPNHTLLIERVTQSEGSYDFLAKFQCSPDLSSGNCTDCLRLEVQYFFECCSHNQARWAKLLYPKCLVNYNITTLQPNFGVTNGKQIFWRTFIAIMTASVLAQWH